jgi:hypothetical protein
MTASSETIAGRLAGLTPITFLILVPLVSVAAHLYLGGSQVAI